MGDLTVLFFSSHSQAHFLYPHLRARSPEYLSLGVFMWDAAAQRRLTAWEHEIDLFGYDDFFGHFPGISSDEYGGQTIKTSGK